MDKVSWLCKGGSDQDHPQEKEMQKGKLVVSGGLTNSWEKKRSERQRRTEGYTLLKAEFQRIARRDLKKQKQNTILPQGSMQRKGKQ